MVHLVLAALGAVAVETKSLVGHELLAASVESGTKGDTAGTGLAWGQRRRLISILGRWGGRSRNLVHGIRGSVQDGISDRNVPKDDAERDQLRGNLSELAQALGDGVGW
jgi:hypothetical protein